MIKVSAIIISSIFLGLGTLGICEAAIAAGTLDLVPVQLIQAPLTHFLTPLSNTDPIACSNTLRSKENSIVVWQYHGCPFAVRAEASLLMARDEMKSDKNLYIYSYNAASEDSASDPKWVTNGEACLGVKSDLRSPTIYFFHNGRKVAQYHSTDRTNIAAWIKWIKSRYQQASSSDQYKTQLRLDNTENLPIIFDHFDKAHCIIMQPGVDQIIKCASLEPIEFHYEVKNSTGVIDRQHVVFYPKGFAAKTASDNVVESNRWLDGQARHNIIFGLLDDHTPIPTYTIYQQ